MKGPRKVVRLGVMRKPRIKPEPGEDGLYSTVDRIVGGQYLLGPVEKEVYLRLMWKVAEFLSVEVWDYCVMDTHAHKLVFCPGVVELSNEELLERIKAYKGERHAEVRAFERAMSIGGDHLEALREGYMDRMGDISEFEKSHTQMFSRWYNALHQRQGTLWMGRFTSVLLENVKTVREGVALYFDLNPVRAEMVSDPKDYRFCAYGAALGGDLRCRKGLMKVMDCEDWESAAAAYRLQLMERGHQPRAGKRGRISRELLLKTVEEKGQLPFATLCRLRIRYFTEGHVLGTEAFVKKAFDRHRSHYGKKREVAGFPLKGFGGSPLRVMRQMRHNPIA